MLPLPPQEINPEKEDESLVLSKEISGYRSRFDKINTHR